MHASEGTVGIDALGAGGLIDDAGRFFFLARPGLHTLSARVLGFHVDSVGIDVESEPLRVDFRLRPHNVSLH